MKTNKKRVSPYRNLVPLFLFIAVAGPPVLLLQFSGFLRQPELIVETVPQSPALAIVTLPQISFPDVPFEPALPKDAASVTTLTVRLAPVAAPVRVTAAPAPALAAAPVAVPPTVAVPVHAAPVTQKSEARLRIASINLDATIKELGDTAAGAMAVPDNNVDVSWYSRGPRPGQIGSAVIGGHNEWDGGDGVFANLHQLKPGDVLSVTDKNGVTTKFVVREMRTYNAEDDATDIFSPADGAYLNLITCSGKWNPATQSYTNRLVVFTDAVQA